MKELNKVELKKKWEEFEDKYYRFTGRAISAIQRAFKKGQARSREVIKKLSKGYVDFIERWS